jgi:hypothetical protein
VNRAERRRLEKQGKKNPSMTIKARELEATKRKAPAGSCKRFVGSITLSDISIQPVMYMLL